MECRATAETQARLKYARLLLWKGMQEAVVQLRDLLRGPKLQASPITQRG